MARKSTHSRGSAKSAEDGNPDARTLGRQVEAGFRDAARAAIEAAHAAGVAVPVLTDDAIGWLHPDGIVRPSCLPVHQPNSGVTNHARATRRPHRSANASSHAQRDGQN